VSQLTIVFLAFGVVGLIGLLIVFLDSGLKWEKKSNKGTKVEWTPKPNMILVAIKGISVILALCLLAIAAIAFIVGFYSIPENNKK